MNSPILLGIFFILSKEIAQNNFQQNIDSENILLALIKQDIFTSKILKKNCVNIRKIEIKLIYSTITFPTIPAPL